MLLQQFARAFHTTRIALAGVEKSALASLRKKTGYTFANCKKALEKHNNDINAVSIKFTVLYVFYLQFFFYLQAEKWLHEQAQSLGWSKATKLAERTTAQGLVGVLIHGNIGAMVEVNCETDFVARNEHFKNFVDHVSRICAKYTETTDFDGDLWKVWKE